ncbi:hypothetical protein FE391_17690 [Nonomuraea sp. KC401]|uniref:hypothetical protein n=1 Tax=unclassified Nonomuraea TaxID=2593643 RepID=UPI0010FED36F|nr:MULTISPECIES: hypothetical protein [unclassified Nonomuraea]NBE95381.1 hypothetical protein [Nonomuraea sp. K271]TLF72081.1 hypothetical protein FE391_17690 [Nonomuraea sp. KC401]
MAEGGRRRPTELVLLALGPVLAAAYAAVNHTAIRAGVRAEVTGPGWEGDPPAAGEMTALGTDLWRLTWWIAAFMGVVAVAYLVMGVLLRRRGRGRTLLMVLSGVLMVPYALVFFAALSNPVHVLPGLYESPDFAAGVPGWQAATPLIVLVAGLAQAAGMTMAASTGRRAARAGAEPAR